MRNPRRELRKVALQAGQQRRVVASPETDDEIVFRVIDPVEAAHVIESDIPDARHKPGRDVAVRRPCECGVVQDRFSQLFVARVAERVLQVVQRLALDPVEVRLGECRSGHCVEKQRIIVRQIVPVDAAVDDRHFRGHRRLVGRGKGVQLIEHLFVAVFERRGIREHRRGDRRQPLLPLGIVLRADLEPDPEVDRRVVFHRNEYGVVVHHARCSECHGRDCHAHKRRRKRKGFHCAAPFRTMMVRRSGIKYFFAAFTMSSGVTFASVAYHASTASIPPVIATI